MRLTLWFPTSAHSNKTIVRKEDFSSTRKIDANTDNRASKPKKQEGADTNEDEAGLLNQAIALIEQRHQETMKLQLDQFTLAQKKEERELKEAQHQWELAESEDRRQQVKEEDERRLNKWASSSSPLKPSMSVGSSPITTMML